MYVLTKSCIVLAWMYTFTVVTGQDCTLADFLNGPLNDANFQTSALADTYPHGNQVRVPCSVGFYGFFKLQCLYGKWSTENLKCRPKECGHPGEAQFADFQLLKGGDFVFGSEVQYTCQKGYQMLSRKSLLRCMANGWDGPAPICQALQCPHVKVDENVEVIGNQISANYRNVLQFNCRSLALYGPREIHCDENGQWSDEPPKCDVVKCKPPLIENGQVANNIETYYENDILDWECNPAYKHSQTLPCRCMLRNLRAEWSYIPLCEPVSCKLTLPPLDGTSYNHEARTVFAPGDTVLVTCTENRWISRSDLSSYTVKCNNDGNWDVTPTCLEVHCHVPRGDNVDFYRTPYYQWQGRFFGDQVNYQCRRDYKATDPNKVATCTRSGWMPNPLCDEITCDKLDVPSNSIVHSLKQKFRLNEHVQWSCKDNIDKKYYITCHKNGWTNLVPCEEQTCDLPEGYELIIDPTELQWRQSVGTTQRYSCKMGYNSKDSKHHATCTDRGWVPTPLCEKAVSCSRPVEDEAVTITGLSDNDHPILVGHVLKFHCNIPGTRLNSSSSLKCGNDGNWSGPIPTCEDISCEAEEVSPRLIVKGLQPDNWMMKIGHKLQFQCDTGYELHGEKEVECSSDGRWSARFPTCAIFCTITDVPGYLKIRNDSMTRPLRIISGTLLKFQCSSGTYIQGSREIECLENGELSDHFPTCGATPTGCGKPTSIPGGDVSGVSKFHYSHGEKVEYTCLQYYTMVGDSIKICQNGVWTGNITCLKPCTVRAADMNLRNITFRHTLTNKLYSTHNDVIEFRCTNGRRVGDLIMIQKCNNGVIPLPLCQ